MSFCTKCGKKLKDGVCAKCSLTVCISEKKVSKHHRFEMLIICLVILLILLILSFTYIKAKVDTRYHVADAFVKYITDNDTDNLQRLLYSENKELIINTENVNTLINYFSNNPLDFNKVQEGFTSGKFDVDSIPLSIKEVGKKFVFFPLYKVVIKPTFIKVETNLKESKVKIGEKIYSDLIEKSDIGPLFPGQHMVIAEFLNSYLNKSEEFLINTFTSDSQTIKPFENFIYINITSDIPDADLYVNDKNTGIKIKDVARFGPVEPGSIIQAVSMGNNKKYISNKYLAKFHEEIYIDFGDYYSKEEALNLIGAGFAGSGFSLNEDSAELVNIQGRECWRFPNISHKTGRISSYIYFDINTGEYSSGEPNDVWSSNYYYY